MSDEQIKGSCFCGAVEFEVNGEPTVMIYCHCKDCQAWNSPLTDIIIEGLIKAGWKPED